MQNLKEKDGGQTGLLILYLYTVPEGKEFVEKDRFDDMELTESYLPSGQLVCPVRVWREENRYVVEETGERAIYLSYDIPNGGAEYCERMVPELEAEQAVGKYGTMTVSLVCLSGGQRGEGRDLCLGLGTRERFL